MRITTKMIVYAIAVAAVLSFGITGTYLLGQRGDFNVHIGTVVDALYFTVATVTTVGYGDIVPVSQTARIFVMVLVVAGTLVIFGTAIGISGDFVNLKLEKLSGKLSRAETRMLKSHTILVGYSYTNALLAEQMKIQKKRFVVVVDDAATAEKVRIAGYTAHIVDEGSESEMSNLAPEKASMVVIDVSERAKTVYAALVAKSLAKKAEIYVVASSAETIRYLREMGIKHIINPSEMAASKILGPKG
ncbi:MAG TPA: NAD-binding protein [Candidatus Baltobacteraceae bacterium]|nr:NAD-binding protein [Candidatus Baltobacteraceae bacterium]